MAYRPPISEDVHERVQLYMVGNTGNYNTVYEDGVKMIIDSNGEPRNVYTMLFETPGDEYEWLYRVKKYAKNNDMDEGEVLESIITNAIEDDGSPRLKFKGKMGL